MPSRSARLATQLAGVGTLSLALAACASAPDGANWLVRFADGAAPAGTVVAHAEIRRGGCDGTALFEDDVPIGAAAGMSPGTLPPGRYGFYAAAHDADCNVLAEGCIALEVPSAGEITVTVVTVSPRAACAPAMCVAGACREAADMGGGVDLGPSEDLGPDDLGPDDLGSTDLGSCVTGGPCVLPGAACELSFLACEGGLSVCRGMGVARSAGTECRAAPLICDTAEVCDGVSLTCPTDGFVGAGTSCRASAGVCDTAEACTGGSASCPSDALAPLGTPCGGSTCNSVGICRATAYIKQSNTGATDGFGFALSLSADGTRLAVGAWQENSSATGIDGNQADDSASASGAVYVFSRTGTTWTQEAYIKASNTGAGDLFGYSLSLSSDGTRLAVGARDEDSSATGVGGDQGSNGAADSGAVYVFSRTGTTWTQEAYVKASNTGATDHFGLVSLSSDGTRLAVGARDEDSSATGVGGSQADNSAGSSGAVYVFSRSGTTWAQEAYVKASNTGMTDTFGYSVSLSSDGTRLAVGAFGEDSSATGIGGDQASNGALESGAAYVFSRSGTTWTQEAYVKASNTEASDNFGHSVSLSADGARLAVGARNEDSSATGIGGSQADNSVTNSGAVYVFSRTATTWTQEAYVKASNTGGSDFFGQSASLSADGTRLAVGAYQEDSSATDIGGNQLDNSATNSGAVYVFSRTGTTWTQEAYVKASNTGADDYFGYSVSLSSDGALHAVGAYFEDSSATGIGGSQADNSAMDSGAVYAH